ncbi:peptidoglycan bridge formation glycyltransferase FemA/FemB family protein [Candidatus Microgenomates bacterium]|nr:peptidoglycan bridge formation glycyltransferase FemA/FemB family protein [Candidatus Microgenomates bacterium]
MIWLRTTQDIHQSEKYGQYMKKIGWIVEKVDNCQIFIRRFPIIGSIIKIQRPKYPIPFNEIEKIAKKYQAFKVVIEPISQEHENTRTREQLKEFRYKKSKSPYLPTKTIHIDLTQPKEKIFKNFSEAKRRAVRRAVKNKVIVVQSKNIEEFIKLKSSQFFPFGLWPSFFVKKDINALWQTFYPKNAVLLRASPTCGASREALKHKKFSTSSNSNFLAGILLLFHQKTAHYWLAGSTKQGNKLFAPTLLVWEALKLSKKRGCQIFDFQGIYDPRFHQATKFWQGFTKFKKGFGGKEIKYPTPYVFNRFNLRSFFRIK